jgi:acyl-CoA reductase-like NAD-dependent aldehyde dehydrogenase
MIERNEFYIGGQWVAPVGPPRHRRDRLEHRGRVRPDPEGNEVDADAAVAAARAAFDEWSRTPPAQRADGLQRVADRLEARSDELTRAIAAEVGMPLKLASRMQVGGPVANWALRDARARVPFEERLGNSLVAREPVGVVAAITPWNYPLNQITLKVAPALAAGCTVVLKPSEVAPINAFLLADAVHEAGLPAGVFNLVTGYGPVVGEALAVHPEVDMVSFTGSTAPASALGARPRRPSSACRSSWAERAPLWCSTMPTSRRPCARRSPTAT